MHDKELNLHTIAQRCSTSARVVPLASAEMWPRIAAIYLAQRKRRITRRLAGAGLAVAASLAGVALVPAWLAQHGSSLDWQARAQALEMQIDALPLPIGTQDSAAQQTETELARLDILLQAAYDRGAQQHELALLWQQRSELLGVLLAARQQQFSSTRI